MNNPRLVNALTRMTWIGMNALLLAIGMLNVGVALAQHPGVWTDADTRASRVETAGFDSLPSKPRWAAAPENLLVVVEAGDHHVSLVDGDRFEVIHRFPVRSALHGGLKITPDGRFAYFGSRDGWVTKYDLWNLLTVAEVRAGLDTHDLALSGDSRWVIVANEWPNTLVLFDANLKLVRSYPVATQDGKTSSRVAAVFDATPRQSFVVTHKDIAELWEISYNPTAELLYDGLVHDFRMGEGIAKPGFLGVRRSRFDETLQGFFFDPSYEHAVGTTSVKGDGASVAQVIHLDVRRKIASFALTGLPHLGSGISFMWKGKSVLVAPNLQDSGATVVDTATWQVLKTIPTPGPGLSMASHAQSRYAWVDSMMHPSTRDTLTVIDKRTLEPVARVREPGRTLSHVTFTRDGRYVLASLSEMDGAIIIYNATSLKEYKRLPMRKPTGTHVVWSRASPPAFAKP